MENNVNKTENASNKEQSKPLKQGAVRRSFSLEDLKKAFEAGDELVSQDCHEREFCIGERCRCKGVRLKYSNFDEWVSQNYA